MEIHIHFRKKIFVIIFGNSAHCLMIIMDGCNKFLLNDINSKTNE